MTIHTKAHRIFWKCDICGTVALWDENWSGYWSYAMEDGCPEDIPTFCGEICRAKFADRMETGEVTVPNVKPHGYGYRITGERRGY